jgi:Fic family protein
MLISPIMPYDLKGQIKPELLELAEKVCIESAKIASGYNQHVVNAFRNVLRITNSYYSNRIEAESTHPIDIEKAMLQQFSDDSKEKALQKLSVSHIKTQEFVESYSEEHNVIDRNFIKEIHRVFYSSEGMEKFTKLKLDDEVIEMLPGEFRKRDVQVGNHIAPASDVIDTVFNYYEKEYSSVFVSSTKATKLLAALSSHHRLVYLHPFLDGNGRVSRLHLDAMLWNMKLEGYGLWNISRGLARDVKKYQNNLSYADMKQQGATDGRGELSLRGLEGYLKYMLECALDQIAFMGDSLRLDKLNEKIRKFVRFSQEGMFYKREALPRYSELLFSHLLVSGELERKYVPLAIGKSVSTATKLVSTLIKMGYIESEHSKAPLRLKVNSFFASQIIPELIPEKTVL